MVQEPSVGPDHGLTADATIWARDGVPLAVRHDRVAEPRGRVVIVHGYAEHLGRYDHVADVLTRAGFDTHRMDVRGHGRSGGPRGHVRRFADYRDDLGLVVDHVIAGDRELAARDGARPVPRAELPLILLGHSAGGLISLNYALHRPNVFNAVAVSSPFLGLRVRVSAIKTWAGSIVSALAPRVSLASEIQPTLLSHDPKVVQAYIDDPLVFKTVNTRWFTEATRAQAETFALAERFPVPVLIMQAADDMIADPERSRALHERIGHPAKKLRMYDNFYHELFNEIHAERVFADLVEWLSRQVAPRA